VKDAWRHFAAEFIGTFALVFLGGAALAASKITDSVTLGPLGVALTLGFTYAVMVSATMRISGHLNPAVTLGFVATRRIDPMMAGVYLVAQLLASILAVYTLQATLPPDLFAAAHGTLQEIDATVTFGQATILELIATFVLVFVVFGTAVDKTAPHIAGLAIGLAYAAGLLAIAPFTGGSLNPARTFGPAVVANNYTGQFVYWLGPCLGGTLAALLYNFLFVRRSREPYDHGAVEPT
jgi:MIP family channel proteins